LAQIKVPRAKIHKQSLCTSFERKILSAEHRNSNIHINNFTNVQLIAHLLFYFYVNCK